MSASPILIAWGIFPVFLLSKANKSSLWIPCLLLNLLNNEENGNFHYCLTSRTNHDISIYIYISIIHIYNIFLWYYQFVQFICSLVLSQEAQWKRGTVHTLGDCYKQLKSGTIFRVFCQAFQLPRCSKSSSNYKIVFEKLGCNALKLNKTIWLIILYYSFLKNYSSFSLFKEEYN